MRFRIIFRVGCLSLLVTTGPDEWSSFARGLFDAETRVQNRTRLTGPLALLFLSFCH
jgi:hypothetical protein